ncbi:hypothetical protein LSH36_582g01012 [Paralvinella palmiformis]|uniref:RRM domain-containing protein n=1 Tax=Paralvinella palmiformis TaxID=53620 RepID=A0AAD9J548_9ANNE|nr:hypothetical protein LSH36_582g01012 [Paralvinella palmiformis]
MEWFVKLYGKIISTKAIIDQNINKCKGYGFVDFECPQDAAVAVKALQAKGVQAQMAKQQEQDPTNLYIANLPIYITENDLENMFSQFGSVISTRILRDPNGMSRGGVALNPYEQSVAQNGVAPTVMTPPGGLLPRYTMPTTPVTTYQLPSTSWIHHAPTAGQYIMPSPVTPVS